MRRILSVLAAASAACALLAAPAPAQTPAACPATFAVLHDDRIGDLLLPAGDYTLTVTGLSCTDAADHFRQFLQDFDGTLPRAWALDPATATFSGPGAAFSVARAAQPSGGGGGRHPAGGTRCPATFHVVHDDRIGALRLPAGQYAITLLAVGRLSCARAAARFTAFLQDFRGRLSGGWIVDAETGTFLRSANVGFRVKPAGTAATGDSPVGRRCGGDAFSIEFPHRFPGLRIPAAAYRVWALGASCNRAEQQLGRLLDLRQGRLPRGWALDAGTATFTRRGTPQFRIKRERKRARARRWPAPLRGRPPCRAAPCAAAA